MGDDLSPPLVPYCLVSADVYLHECSELALFPELVPQLLGLGIVLNFSERLQQENTAYQLFTDCLGIPRQDAKDVEGTVVPVFGLEVDTNKFIVRVPPDKVARA